MRSYFQIHFVISPVSLLHYGANVILTAAIYSAAIIDKRRKFCVLLLLNYMYLLLYNSLVGVSMMLLKTFYLVGGSLLCLSAAIKKKLNWNF